MEETRNFLCDSARRRVFVANAIGLTKNEREMKAIIDICTEWGTLYWDLEAVPDLRNTR
eukprot:CAMPEP_0194258116 /NCGR_PEP_ID=MMETSP0158-20130606/40633_1 /TAXON_ID=33649 /ORGANISM="Thalassionema nitzschioides, Strain L26-B" /LENGTH=58 /DNA_ID=CAMNT_0038997407 /DNA_START=175 /DNA_END=348 /DNA_ORIENTATION=+